MSEWMEQKEYDFTNMTCSEIDALKVEKEKALQQAQSNLNCVEVEELELAKKIIDLQSKRKDLQIVASKARQIVRTLNLDIKIITSAFWSARDNR
jgi:molybdopterin-biosynthesis enzyme MoeA-like protein